MSQKTREFWKEGAVHNISCRWEDRQDKDPSRVVISDPPVSNRRGGVGTE